MIKHKNKILALGFIGVLIVSFGAWHVAEAADSSIYVFPTQLNKEIGDRFVLAVKVNPSGQKVCVVEGELNLSKLSCQKITMGTGISAQSSPSCDDLSFLLGIQGCATSKKTLFTVTVKAEDAGSGTAGFTGVDIIGEGVSVSSDSSGGSYVITSSCNCGVWSAWQDGVCGGGNCSSVQRLQTRTRLCSPSGCETKSENQCRDDSGCMPRSPAVETKEEKIEGTEEIIQQPIQEGVEEARKEETSVSKELTSPGGKLPQKSLLASLGMAWEEIIQSVFLVIIVILCLAGLIFIGIREWRMFRKKRKK